MMDNMTNTISGNVPEKLTETNSLLQTFLNFIKSCFGISEEEELDMQTVADAQAEKAEAEKEYREAVTESLEEIREYIQSSVSDNNMEMESVSGNEMSVSGNLPGEDFYDDVTAYMLVSAEHNEVIADYMKDIHSIGIIILCGVGLILGVLFAHVASRWWKHA